MGCGIVSVGWGDNGQRCRFEVGGDGDRSNKGGASVGRTCRVKRWGKNGDGGLTAIHALGIGRANGLKQYALM